MRILVTTCGSPCSDVAFQDLLKHQTYPGNSAFRVVSILESIVGAYPITECYVDSMFEAEAALKEERTKLVTELVEQIKKAFPESQVEGAVIFGYAAEEILRQASNWQADLIIMGSHSRHGINHFIMGSVAEKVAREACCSVEIIRAPHVSATKKTVASLSAT